MLGKKQFRAIFLFEFKMGHKVVETTCNVNSAFAPGTVNKYTVQWCSRSFAKETRVLKMEEHSGLPSEVDSNQLRGSLKLILLTVTWEVAKELSVDHSLVVWHLKQIGKVRKLDKWVPHEMTAV